VEEAKNLRAGCVCVWGGGGVGAREGAATHRSLRDGGGDAGLTEAELVAGQGGEMRGSVPVASEVDGGSTGGC
jgi:hypothetical protein